MSSIIDLLSTADIRRSTRCRRSEWIPVDRGVEQTLKVGYSVAILGGSSICGGGEGIGARSESIGAITKARSNICEKLPLYPLENEATS